MAFGACIVENEKHILEVWDCSLENEECSPEFEECNPKNGQNKIVSGNSLQDTVQRDWEIFEIARGIEGRSFWEKDNIPVNEKYI